jgi:hypothetical protein
MSDNFLVETPNLATRYCPGCEPERDPLVGILEVFWCQEHELIRDGEADRLVSVFAYLSGGAEAGGEDNRRWCASIHRGCSDAGEDC